ncbi:glycosyltransferase [Bosea sp. (in: a-proteobacteria)]|uniref:glycosyltransferase family protein n=1 Tax=Bosea sp. (in: a-proteobacteria) TaxID=1871050 RepID=UPI00122608F8|nr:glycosyltransferase [Bosea sp. (in: a-proteobacteria)]TAJ29735.1 MAG: glycosyltransferase [Bosea sp. (in: a-proteobacteria)]
MSGSVLIAVTHLLGSGHLVRAAQLARALAEDGFSVTLASGGMPLRPMAGEPFAFLQLPPVRTEGVDFRNLLDEGGLPAAPERMAARIAMLEEEATRLAPNAVITEHFPFGRRQLAGEFQALIAAARIANPAALVLSSIRDVLVTPKPARIAEAQERIARLFDAVLVHGEESVLPLARSWPMTAELAGKLRYVGYLGNTVASPPLSGDGAGEILVSGGGSAAATPLFELALEAARLSSGPQWHVLVGRGVSEGDFARLAASAPANATVERARPDFPALLARCALSISQAGYNTVLDLVAAGRPAIVVPFDAGGETEQGVRADALAQAGIATCLRLDALTPQRLADAVAAGIGRPVPRGLIAIDDGRRAAAAVKRLLARRRWPADP